jgi:hypothetical protein
MRKISVLLGVLMVALAGSAAAQTGSLGYYPIEEMGIFTEGDLEVDIDLSGAMIQVAAGAVENQDEGLADLVANLERVRVQVGEPSGVDAAGVARRMADAKTKLEGAGWHKIISVEESTEQVYLYALERDARISGLTGFVNEAGEEVVIINIVGDVDPRTLGRVLAHLGGVNFEEIMAGMEGFEQ